MLIIDLDLTAGYLPPSIILAVTLKYCYSQTRFTIRKIL